jgi:rod shape-determining protein MreC
MTSSSTIFQKNRRIFNFGLALVLLGLIIFSPNFVRPQLGNFTNWIFYYFFSEIKSYRLELEKVVVENRRLNNLVAENALQISAMAEAHRENQRLREFLGFEQPENYKTIPVKIISLLYMQDIYPVAAVINKGSIDSLTVNLPIINRLGLVGKIKEVMPDFSTVSLLTDPSNAVSGRVAESRQIGIVRYSKDKGMFLDNLPADAPLSRNDLIISSGLGGVYPAGLSVARVDSTQTEKGDILKKVWLSPTVNFLEIDELYVLMDDSS